MKNKAPFVIISIVAVIAVVGAILYANMGKANPNPVRNNNPANSRANNAVAPTNASAGATPAWSKGPVSAPVTIEEFADFQCPSCAYFHTVLKEVKTVYGDRVRVTFRQFPLQMHPYAFDAARAAEAAGIQGADKFWAMHDKLFEKQKDWSVMPNARDEFVKYAGEIGLDVEKFKTDMVGMIANSRVEADKKRGADMRVGSTPSVYLNGRLLIPEEMTSPKMRQLIDAALMEKK